MSSYQVVTVFAIYQAGDIVSGGSFGVGKEPRFYDFPSSDGGYFRFQSSYSESNCLVNVRNIKDGKETCSSHLNAPINRTKKKFKETMLGENYKLFYRSCFEKVA